MELENIILSEVNPVQKDRKGACFLSNVEHRPKTNTNIIIHTCKYTHNMAPKVGLWEETKGGEKEGNNDKEWIIMKYIISV
jgi:hypothetical protein